MPSSPRPLLPPLAAFGSVASHLIVPPVLATVMSLAYLGGFHKPAPHEPSDTGTGAVAVRHR